MTPDDQPASGEPQAVVRAGSNLGYVSYGAPEAPPGLDRASAVRPARGSSTRAGHPVIRPGEADSPARSPIGVVIRSLVVPGWGHILMGRVTSAVVLFLAAVLGAAAAAALAPPGVLTAWAGWAVVAVVAALTAGRTAYRTAETHRALEQRGV